MTRTPNFVPTINGNPQWHLGSFRHEDSAASAAYVETQAHPEKYLEPRTCGAKLFTEAERQFWVEQLRGIFGATRQ